MTGAKLLLMSKNAEARRDTSSDTDNPERIVPRLDSENLLIESDFLLQTAPIRQVDQ